MITVYVESPFVVHLALAQEHAAACRRLLEGTANGFEIALPMVALVEPLYVQRGHSMQRRRLADEWRLQVAELKRTSSAAHQDALAAIEDALIRSAPIDDEDRKSVASIIEELSRRCRVMPFREHLFKKAHELEQRTGLTSVDALAVATIIDEPIDPTKPRAFLSLDKKSMLPASAELRSAGLAVCHDPIALEGWLSAQGVTL